MFSILPLAASLALATAPAPVQEPEFVTTAPKAPLQVEKAIVRQLAPPPPEPKFKHARLSAPELIRTPARFVASNRIAAPSAEAISIRTRDEWVHSDGFSFSGSKLGFKRRF